MARSVKYSLSVAPLQPETVIALISELPFSGFEEQLDQVDAYLPIHDDSPAVAAALQQVADRFALQVRREVLPDVNYNAEWEASYKAVVVEDFVCIRAPFHAPAADVKHQLTIVPEMSFGTGHHATTYLMAAYLRDYSPFGKTCFDFGTGTGVLAMLAKLEGATHVVATDIDERCVRSTRENALRNSIKLDEVRLGTEDTLPDGSFDLILANINRAVLVKAMPQLASLLTRTGKLYISGILSSDAELIHDVATRSGLQHIETRQRGEWLACRFGLNYT